MTTPDSDYFHGLPPQTSNSFGYLPNGQKVTLILLEYVSTREGMIFLVQYIHQELIYRNPGHRDAVSFGTAKLDVDNKYQEVRILFSKTNKTATLRGLVLEGEVKLMESLI